MKASSRSRNKAASEILDAACAKWTSLPSLTLARKLFNEHPLVFASIASARSSIAYRRGRRVWGHRSKRGGVFGAAGASTPTVAFNPYFLPPSDEREWGPQQITVDRDTRALVISDIHVPYHNVPAVTATIAYGRKIDARLILLNGDIMDCHQVSSFDRVPTAKRMKEEVSLTNQLLDALQEAFPKARFIFKDGNHEERLDRYVRVKAAEIWDLETTTIAKLLELRERGFEYITDKRPIMLGKLPVIHGHEFRRGISAPVNAARGLFLRAITNCMKGDSHTTSEHSAKDIKGNLLTTWSVGCLCELHPQYDPLAQWNHGFADVELAKDGTFEVHNHRIDRGRILN